MSDPEDSRSPAESGDTQRLKPFARSAPLPAPLLPAPHTLALPDGFPAERLRALYDALLLPRVIEEKMLVLLRQGRLSKWFSGVGQEAIAVGVVSALQADDWILPLHRNLGVFTARGVDLPRLFRQLFGKAGGFTEGRDRTFHFGVLEKRVVGMISHLGAMLPVADGLALASQLRGDKRVAAVFSGDGGASEGDFHEALNLAAVWKLPVVFVIENNQWGLSTPVSEQFACRSLADRALGYGMPGATVDGNDLLGVVRAVSRAADRARRGDGPTLLELKTYRMRGHEEASGIDYVPKEVLEQWGPKDPIVRFEKLLEDTGVLRAPERERLRAAHKARVDALVEEALQAPEPEADPSMLLRDVYAPGVAPAPARAALEPELKGVEMRYVDAVSDGLREAMRADPRIVLLGQDVAEYGGVFKVTQGFAAELGKARVRNTPIIESGALGCALGLALDGFLPTVEMQFGDFISCGFNQIVNNLAKNHFRWGAGAPVVVRAPVGGGTGAGPFHSQNPEAWFTSVAGLKVVAPATPYDAKGLLLAAFEDGNPVLYLEHKQLYRSARGPVPAGHYTVPIGRARLARAGAHATIVTYGVGVGWAMDAAMALHAEDGREVEVVDLRSLLPWDQEAVLASVKKTGRALVLHEAPLTGGFGGEVAATIGRLAFEWLDAPVFRLGALDTPVPFSKPLENAFSPRARVLPELRALLAY
jgi:2-oxoisovalerate dehydrogenase E1 component